MSTNPLGTMHPHVPCIAVGNIELPREYRRLYDLAYNLWWTWTPAAQELFAMVDSVAWGMYRNPVQLLINVEPTRWERLLEDETFTSAYAAVVGELDHYMAGQRGSWFGREHGEYAGGPVAYFSMEYGLHACLPLYAGGLGVLSGDHLKGASNLGIPLVAVGLLYRHGYFHQTVDADGVQQHAYLEYDFNRLPVRPVANGQGGRLLVHVPFPGRELAVQVWTARVGRVWLLLLSSDVPENHPADRPITDILYVRSREVRLAQEIVLGVGGVRALAALGIAPGAWHLNEGHSTLVQVERLRAAGADGGAFAAALEQVRRTAVFTTHTPVPAGNERFDAPLARRYLEGVVAGAGFSVDEVLALGHDGTAGGVQAFNLTAFGVRGSARANAVSRLNAEVCDRMWRHLRPEVPASEPVIRPITNGVHTASWCGRAVRQVLERAMGGGAAWQDRLLDSAAWEEIAGVPDEELWAAHLAQKERLAAFVRSRLREQFARHGRSPDELRALDAWFDPQVLTIAFARRFATYKRVWLVFSDLDRLRALVADAHRPVQIVFSGKAHPADRPGQDLIRQTVQMGLDPALRGRVYFLEDYDMRIASMLVQGADVWLNTPRRPLEASGTSGQKAALNGALNVSILDGWWPEAYDGENGWAITTSEQDPDEARQDRADAEALYRVLETEVIPTYYDRDAGGLPRRWIGRMKRAIATIAPRFSAARMVREYAEQAYLPVARG